MIALIVFFFSFLTIFFFCCSWYLAESHENNTKTHRGNSNQIGFSNLHRLGTATLKANHHIETANVHKDTRAADNDIRPPTFSSNSKKFKNTHLPYAKPQYHKELTPTERTFRWPRRFRDNQRPSKFLVLLPIS